MDLVDTRDWNASALQVSRGSFSTEEAEAHLVEAACDGSDCILVEIIHREKDRALTRQAVVRGELSFRERHSERACHTHHLSRGSHFRTEYRIELAELRERKHGFLHRDVVRDDLLGEPEVGELLTEDS